MKNVLFLLLVALPMIGFSQANSIENIYSKYKNNENTTTLTFGSGLIKFAASFEDDVDSKVLEKISQVKLLITEGNEVSKSDFKGFSKSLKKDKFEDLMQINAEGTLVNIMIREQGKRISDVVLLVNEEEDFILISIEGNFEYSDLNDIKLNLEGGEFLKKLPENRKSLPRA